MLTQPCILLLTHEIPAQAGEPWKGPPIYPSSLMKGLRMVLGAEQLKILISSLFSTPIRQQQDGLWGPKSLDHGAACD